MFWKKIKVFCCRCFVWKIVLIIDGDNFNVKVCFVFNVFSVFFIEFEILLFFKGFNFCFIFWEVNERVVREDIRVFFCRFRLKEYFFRKDFSFDVGDKF